MREVPVNAGPEAARPDAEPRLHGSVVHVLGLRDLLKAQPTDEAQQERCPVG
jgi:hypothetical protein